MGALKARLIAGQSFPIFVKVPRQVRALTLEFISILLNGGFSKNGFSRRDAAGHGLLFSQQKRIDRAKLNDICYDKRQICTLMNFVG
jgi:hypothetical protein